ncbi:hypothetical protein CBL_04543 [Carabus blaptoides fortunei]
MSTHSLCIALILSPSLDSGARARESPDSPECRASGAQSLIPCCPLPCRTGHRPARPFACRRSPERAEAGACDVHYINHVWVWSTLGQGSVYELSLVPTFIKIRNTQSTSWQRQAHRESEVDTQVYRAAIARVLPYRPGPRTTQLPCSTDPFPTPWYWSQLCRYPVFHRMRFLEQSETHPDRAFRLHGLAPSNIQDSYLSLNYKKNNDRVRYPYCLASVGQYCRHLMMSNGRCRLRDFSLARAKCCCVSLEDDTGCTTHTVIEQEKEIEVHVRATQSRDQCWVVVLQWSSGDKLVI